MKKQKVTEFYNKLTGTNILSCNVIKTKMTVRSTMEAAVTAASKDHLELSAPVHQDFSSSMTPRPVKTSTSV